MSKPLIGISMGDPAGIGPEILVRTVADEAVNRVARCLVYGDALVIDKAVQESGLKLKVRAIGKPDEARFAARSIEVCFAEFATGTLLPYQPKSGANTAVPSAYRARGRSCSRVVAV